MFRRYCQQYGEVILLLVLIAICAFLIQVGLQIPVGRSKALITPSTWPVACLILIAGCALALLLLRFFRKNTPAQDDAKGTEDAGQIDAESGEVIGDAVHPRRAVYTILFMVGYMALIPVAGFILASVVGMGLYMLSLRVRYLYALLIPTLLTALLTGIFAIALQVPLPRGISVFQNFSQLFF
jgi:hypothetical protein